MSGFWADSEFGIFGIGAEHLSSRRQRYAFAWPLSRNSRRGRFHPQSVLDGRGLDWWRPAPRDGRARASRRIHPPRRQVALRSPLLQRRQGISSAHRCTSRPFVRLLVGAWSQSNWLSSSRGFRRLPERESSQQGRLELLRVAQLARRASAIQAHVGGGGRRLLCGRKGQRREAGHQAVGCHGPGAKEPVRLGVRPPLTQSNPCG